MSDEVTLAVDARGRTWVQWKVDPDAWHLRIEGWQWLQVFHSSESGEWWIADASGRRGPFESPGLARDAAD